MLLTVDHNLVYSYPKMFLLFFGLILTVCAWLKIFFLDPYYDFFLDLTGKFLNQNLFIKFPHIVSLIFPFLIHNECKPILEGKFYHPTSVMWSDEYNLYMSLSRFRQTYSYIAAFCSCTYILFSSLALYTKYLNFQP